jgi:tRNA 2-thiouridine synthesizing protein E
MPDTPKFTPEPGYPSADGGHGKSGLREWNREIAMRTALLEGITMTLAHWEVIEFLRAYYLDHGPAPSGRALASALEIGFAERGGSKYLFRLFPDGPVAQGSRIAGLPVPPYTEDTSFGSTM